MFIVKEKMSVETFKVVMRSNSSQFLPSFIYFKYLQLLAYDNELALNNKLALNTIFLRETIQHKYNMYYDDFCDPLFIQAVEEVNLNAQILIEEQNIDNVNQRFKECISLSDVKHFRCKWGPDFVIKEIPLHLKQYYYYDEDTRSILYNVEEYLWDQYNEFDEKTPTQDELDNFHKTLKFMVFSNYNNKN